MSAFQFRGTPLKLLTLAAERKIDLAISDHIVEEVTRTLRQKFDWPEDRIVEARRIMGRVARRVVPSQTRSSSKKTPTTTGILECAAEAESDYIVSGDRRPSPPRALREGARHPRSLTCWTWYWGRIDGVESSDECQVVLRDHPILVMVGRSLTRGHEIT